MKSLRIHYIQHVPFEDIAMIGDWAVQNGHQITNTQVFNNPVFPATEDFDWLVILGGPMNIYEETLFPWLKAEKQFSSEAIETQKKIIGVCLGSQLLADALGGKVFKNKEPEIGWFPVVRTHETSELLKNIPEKFTCFHWHGDTFSLPEPLQTSAYSEACQNQLFTYNNQLIGLQFHLECDLAAIKSMLKNGADEIRHATYIQNVEFITSQTQYIPKNQKLLFTLLDNLAEVS